MIGAVDHNSAGNARALTAAAGGRGEPVHVLPGLEIESAEGVHVVCLCDNAEAAEALQELVWAHLPETPNRAQSLGEQWLMDSDGQRVGRETRLLLQATQIKLEEICREGRRRGFLTIPAHVTRKAYGLFGVLGFVPDGLRGDALELGPLGRTPMPLAGRAQGDLARHPPVRASDAHRLEEIGTACTDFWLAEPTVAELRMALRQHVGRAAAIVTQT